MLAPASTFADLVLAVHILAVVSAFGVSFAYPVLEAVGERLDRRTTPAFYRMRVAVSRRLTNPGLLVILIAGIYLASDEHRWKQFFVQWGIAMVVILGGLEGGFMLRRLGRLAELSERDLAAAPGGQWSPEFVALRRQVVRVGTLMSLIVVVTVFLMATHAGA